MAVPGGHLFAALAVGNDFTVAVLPNKSLLSWGRNDMGQLGQGTTAPSATPALVPVPLRASSVAAGENHMCAVDADTQDTICYG